MKGYVSLCALCTLLLLTSSMDAQAQSTIVFDTDRDGAPGDPNREVYVMKDDGSAQTNRTNHHSFDAFPSICPDGKKIVFQSAGNSASFPDDDKLGDIFAMNSDGTGTPNNLTQTPEGYATAPDCGRPSGTQQFIVFAWTTDPTNEPLEIWRMNTNGGQQQRLTTNSVTDTDPRWCGDKIVFATNADGDFDLYKMTEWGANPTPLTVNSVDDRHPSCSADGQRIAFTRYTNEGGCAAPPETVVADIYAIDISGGNEELLEGHPARDTQPTWSPGGTMIAFVSDRDHASGEIYRKVAEAGALPQRLTDNTAVDGAPDWAELVGFPP